MRIWRLEIMGREIFRFEEILKFTPDDFMAHRMMMSSDEGGPPEECCECVYEEAEEGDPCVICGEPLTEEDVIDSKFSNMTERIVWDSRTEDYPMPGIDEDEEA